MNAFEKQVAEDVKAREQVRPIYNPSGDVARLQKIDGVPVTTGHVIEGVGKDAPTAMNKHGGKQSDSPYRVDLIPPLAILDVAKVLKRGAVKYGENNWHAITIEENLNHLLAHVYAYLAGDKTDSHLSNVACRALFALEQLLSNRDAILKAEKK